MRLMYIAVLAVATVFSVPMLAQSNRDDVSSKAGITANKVVINSFSDLQEYFRYSPDRDIIISGHRGGMMPGYPEN